ncbi:MAG: hypothetical protein C5B54_02275 [Acidobacteria bacterium]|nr:MAG: hypothetical protein C5B54_02275 [Acidobacteriota bacterium]
MIRVLLVDERQETVLAYHAMLMERGYLAEIARSGAEASEKLRTHHWDVVITDLDLEDSNGLRIVAEARRSSPLASIFLLSEYSDLHWALQGIPFGVSGILVRPCNFEQLEASIQQELAKRSYDSRLQEEVALYELLAEMQLDTFDRSSAMEAALKKILPVLRFDAAALFQYESTTQILDLIASIGLPPDVRQVYDQFHLGEGLVGQTAVRERIVLQEDPTGSATMGEPFFLSSGAVPLLHQDRLTGVLALFSRSNRILKPPDLRLLNTAGRQIAHALAQL